jgi:4-alpha-glucanotransferase
MKGPDMALFRAFREEFGSDLPIIAEDLGYLTPAVKKLLKSSGFPGMKVLQFAFDTREESDYLPHNYPHHCVLYTGTHDNDTILGWTKTACEADVAMAHRYLRPPADEEFNWTMMRAALMSVADTCILMMNDLIGGDSSYRINVPSTIGTNWLWRIDGVCINDTLLKSIDNLVPGIELSMIVHPNSNTIMELHADSRVLLEFQNTSEKLTGEATGFMGLGLFCYVLSACGLINLLFLKKR